MNQLVLSFLLMVFLDVEIHWNAKRFSLVILKKDDIGISGRAEYEVSAWCLIYFQTNQYAKCIVVSLK